jgi:hypothetical protein
LRVEASRKERGVAIADDVGFDTRSGDDNGEDEDDDGNGEFIVDENALVGDCDGEVF